VSTEQQQALWRLAILEDSRLKTWAEVLEWAALRRWALDNNLMDEYKEQPYFACRREITKIQYAPKKSSSLFSRFLTLLGINK
jgi:hypothetical protein